MTPFSSRSDRTELDLVLEAIHLALADAGIQSRDVDGLLTYSAYGEGVHPLTVAGHLGAAEAPRLLENNQLGGNMSAMILGYAQAFLASHMADITVIYRGFNGRSGTRMGGADSASAATANSSAFGRPFGLHGAPSIFAMRARRYIERYGIKQEDMGAVAVTFREHAQLNEHARTYGMPLTIDDYLASPLVVDPFRRLDCCFEVDGAAALVVTRLDHARDLPHRPVEIVGSAYAYGGSMTSNPAHERWEAPGKVVARRLHDRFGFRPEQVDVAELCDDYTYSLVTQLEELGFCEPGEGPAFAATGNLSLSGSLPCNTNGGQLSEGFMHGLNQVVEAVIQLRGDAAGRQVSDASLALVTGTNAASAALLRGHA